VTDVHVALTPRVLKTVLPFIVALAAGIGLSQLIDSGVRRTPKPESTTTETTLMVLRVPEVDFSEGIKRSTGVYASIRLHAVFAADGQVTDVRPIPMLPYGVPESAAGYGNYIDVTPAMLNGRFVKNLPYGLTDVAIEQARKIQFVPRKINDQPVCDSVAVLVNFEYNESRWSTGCDSIELTVMNDKGVVWHANIWVHRNRGCIMI
jgi:hypothetical protein